MSIETEKLRTCIGYICSILTLIFFFGIAISFALPWFSATTVTRINTCCLCELDITGYLFTDYDFSLTHHTERSCDKTSCANITKDDFLSQMESDIKQDTSSAESTLAFVRASPLLILCHMVVSLTYCCLSRESINQRAMLLMSILMTTMSIAATAGVAVYSDVYINQIGFNYDDLGIGWTLQVVVCSLTLIFDMILLVCNVCFYLDEQILVNNRKDRKKVERSTNCIATISQPNNVQNYQLQTHQSQTNTSQTQLPQNKITADDWLFVKLDDRDTVVEIHESVLFKRTLTCTDHMDNAVTNLHKTIKLKINTFESSKNEIVIYVQKLLDKLWDQDLVGKGADAKNLSHKTLNVISVDPGYKYYNINVRKYMGYISGFLKRIKRFGKLPCLNAAHCRPIQTSEFIENVQNEFLSLMGMDNLNTRLNEYFLFHGTRECNVDNILDHGFDISKVKRPFLGKGMYFTESPVKADQYTGDGSSSTGCILLCRVILGNFVIRKKRPESNMTSWNHLPCSRCLDENCSQHSPDERFDSLIYDQPNGLFREFVIFNTDQILVESVIKYNRVSHLENLDS